MYTQQDLDEAISAGAMTPDAAASLRQYVDTQRSTHTVDEEQFRLITSFNDIFVSIASVILLVAVGWIAQAIGQATGIIVSEHGNVGPSPLAPLAVAATAWGLALFFTGKRRMALPSIILLIAFVGAVAALTISIESMVMMNTIDQLEKMDRDRIPLLLGGLGAVAGVTAAAAAWFHWRRFKVPITVAIGALSVVGIAVALIVSILGNVANFDKVMLGFVLLLGVGVFLFAMRWDSSDPLRQTRRSDVAFWLHLLAAPMIVHPVFALLGLNDGSASIGEGLVVVALYIALGVTALAIDRRALLVSALAYVLFALSSMFKQFGAVELNVALTALIIGSSLLLLSAFWHQARRVIVQRLPAPLQGKLPSLDRIAIAAA